MDSLAPSSSAPNSAVSPLFAIFTDQSRMLSLVSAPSVSSVMIVKSTVAVPTVRLPK
jgi:hypothetical protein